MPRELDKFFEGPPATKDEGNPRGHHHLGRSIFRGNPEHVAKGSANRHLDAAQLKLAEELHRLHEQVQAPILPGDLETTVSLSERKSSKPISELISTRTKRRLRRMASKVEKRALKKTFFQKGN